MLANHTYVILVSSLAARYALRTGGDTRVYASGTGRLMGPPCFIGTRHMKEISTASLHLLVNVNMSLPIPPVTIQQLVEARRLLGPVGVRPFRTYVQKTYGPLTEEMAREFLRMPVRRGATAGDAITAQDTRMQNMAQVFAPAPASKGRVVATGPKSDWAVDTIDLRGRTKKRGSLSPYSHSAEYLHGLHLRPPARQHFPERPRRDRCHVPTDPGAGQPDQPSTGTTEGNHD